MEDKIYSDNSGYNKKSVLMMGLRVILYSLILTAITFIVLMDAQRPELTERFSEQSYTEYAQESALLAATLLFYLCARLYPNQKVPAYLIGGFLGMALIREYDAFLDSNVSNSAWQILVYSLAAFTAYLVYLQRKQFWWQLNNFIHTRPFGMIITGILIVFIFSRFYGYKQIWISTMGEPNYKHIVTRAGEEAIELLGYSLILIGAVEYFFFLKKNNRYVTEKKEDLTFMTA